MNLVGLYCEWCFAFEWISDPSKDGCRHCGQRMWMVIPTLQQEREQQNERGRQSW